MSHWWHHDFNGRVILDIKDAKKLWLSKTEHHSNWLENVNVMTTETHPNDCFYCWIININWHLTMQDIRANK
jgi:hypothetical protein